MTRPMPIVEVLVAVVLVAAVLIACSVLPGCGNGAAATSSSAKTSAVDERLVVLSPAAAVMLRDLGLADLIVGKHDYDLVLGDAVPAVGHQEALDYEAILGVEPTEIIIEWGSRPLPPRLEEFAETHGWRIRRITLLTVDDIARTVDDLAIAFGVVSLDTTAQRRPTGVPDDLGSFSDAIRFEDPARRFEAEMPSAALARACSRRGDGFGAVGPVLLLGSTSPPGVLGPGSFHHQILERIGGEPAVLEGSPWMQLDAEDVLRLNPSAIVLIAPRGVGADAREIDRATLLERLGRVGTLEIDAVRDGRVALIDDPLCLLPSTAMAGFADRLAEILDGWGEGRPIGRPAARPADATP